MTIYGVKAMVVRKVCFRHAFFDSFYVIFYNWCFFLVFFWHFKNGFFFFGCFFFIFHNLVFSSCFFVCFLGVILSCFQRLVWNYFFAIAVYFGFLNCPPILFPAVSLHFYLLGHFFCSFFSLDFFVFWNIIS